MSKEIWNGVSLNESEQNLLEFMNSDIDNTFGSLETLKENLVDSSILNEGVADMYLVESIKDKAKEAIKKLKEFFKKIIDWISQKVRGHKMELMLASYEEKDNDKFFIIKTISGKVIKKIKIESDKTYGLTVYDHVVTILKGSKSDIQKGYREMSKDEDEKDASIEVSQVMVSILDKVCVELKGDRSEVNLINKSLKRYNEAVNLMYSTSKFSLKELNKEKDSFSKSMMKLYNRLRKLISKFLNIKNIIRPFDSMVDLKDFTNIQ